MHGIGKFVTEVYTFVGQWVEGTINGSGKLWFHDGSKIYVGGFCQGFVEGYGQATHRLPIQH